MIGFPHSSVKPEPMADPQNLFPDLHLGAQFRRLADAAGGPAAMILCRHFGGQEGLYIPMRADADCPLRAAIGDDAFAGLSAAFGGQHLSIPMPPQAPPKKMAVMDAVLAGGASARQIATACGVTQRYVRSVRAQLAGLGCALPGRDGRNA